MGDAPPDDGPLAMPDPERVVGRSVAMLLARGFERKDALMVVATVADNALMALAAVDIEDVTWLEEVSRIAWQRRVSRPPSPTEHTGEDHADGTGS